MIERKKKECVECGNLRYIFSKGRCEYCSKKVYMSKSRSNAKSKRKKARKKKLQKLSNLKKDARYWFQRYVRYKAIYMEDGDTYCAYGCGKRFDDPSECQGGHYLKAELYPEAIFDEDNVFPVCAGCNIRDPILEYRKNLVNIKGEQWVQDIEDKYKLQRGRFKWDRTYLEEIKDTYKQKCIDLEEEINKSKVK